MKPSINQIIERLQASEIKLELDEHDKLSLVCRKDLNVPPELIALVREFKTELIEEIKSHRSSSGEVIAEAPEREVYPLSSSQKSLWILNQFEGGALAYNNPSVVALDHSYDIELLSQAINEVMARHEILRTVFVEDDQGEVGQKILPVAHVDLSIKTIDLSGSEEALKEAEAYISDDSYAPFDLEKGPLIRVAFFVLNAQKILFYYNLHHIISDAWSMQLLNRDTLAIYEALKSGKTAELPDLNIHYKDYAFWQQEQLASEAMDGHRKFWLEQFSGDTPLLDLPISKLRPKVKTYNGRRLATSFSQNLTQKIEIFAKQEGTSLFVVIMSAWYAFFHRYCSINNIVLGTSLAGREHPELENQLGFYIRTLALKCQIEDGDTFLQVCKKTKRLVIEAIKHQSYPFDLLVEELDFKRDQSRSPIFDIMVTFLNSNVTSDQNHVKSGTITDLGESMSRFDMDITFEQYGDSIYFELDFNTDIYEQASVERFMSHFSEIISALLDEPTEKISQIDYLSPKERNLLLNDFNDTYVEIDESKSFIDHFGEQVSKSPDAIAVKFGDKTLSYQELEQRSNQLAHYLSKEFSPAKGDLIAVTIDRSDWLVVSILAIFKLRGVYVPIDPTYPEERIAYLLEDSQCKYLLDESIIREFSDHISSYPKDDLTLKPDGQDVAYVIYTSGSTGKPKGAIINHVGLLNHLLAMEQNLHLDASTKIAQTAPQTFDISIWQLLNALITGGSTIVYDGQLLLDPGSFLSHLFEDEVNILQLVPSYLNSLLEIDDSEKKLKRLSYLLVTGEKVDWSIVDRWFQLYPDIKVVNAYGPAEASDDVTLHTMDSVPAGSQVSIGKPIMNTQLYVVDEYLALCPMEVVGEICISGICLGQGYLNRPELTAERFIPNPFVEGERMYRTGDMGRWLPDGTMEYLGRKDDQVKVRGYRIELGEIEHYLLACEGVSQGAVIARNLSGRGAELIGYMVMEKGDVSEVRTHLQHVLPSYMVPSHLVELETLPLTPNGKLDKKALPDPEQAKTEAMAYVPPRNQAEEVLVQAMEEVLKRDGIGIGDNFFELGGDSIKSIQITSRLKQKGFGLKVQDILRNPEVGVLSTFMSSLEKSEMDQSEVTGDVVITPVQADFFNASYISQHHHNNQSVLLQSSERIDMDQLSRCLDYLTVHHDALRMVFQQGNEGWQQRNRPSSEGERFSLVEIDLRSEADEQARMDSYGQTEQASIDLAQGPLLKALCFRLSDDDRLGLIIHHLVIDGVSWRILLEDLSTLYGQAMSGSPFALPPKTDSYQRWARELKDHATTAVMQAEHGYWQDQLVRHTDQLPVDGEAGQVLVYDTKKGFSLPTDITQLLSEQVHGVYNTDINDLLLTSLGLALREVFGANSVSVLLEGHGREEILDSLDISRTVGWFTSMYPYVLEVGALEEDMALVHVKESLRQVPNKGIGYGVLAHLGQRFPEAFEPSIEFNYLGDFGDNAAGSSDGIFSYAAEDETIGNEIGEENGSEAKLSIGGMTVSGSLSLWISYSSRQYDQSTIDQLLKAYESQLRSMIVRLSSHKEKLLTPSDLTFKGLSIKELNSLNSDGGIEDVYPLSPLQSGIYFHWLADSSTSLYFEQVSYTLRSSIIEEGILRQAYEQLIERHGVLRTSFRNDLEGLPLQVVHKSPGVEKSFSYEVLPAGMSVAERQAYIAERKLTDRAKGFDLGTVGQMRLLVLEIEENLYEFIWSHHHILMDAWCISQLVNDFYLLMRGEQLSSPPRPYAHYIGWLEALDQQQSATYWKDYLSGYTDLAEAPFKKQVLVEERNLQEEQLVISGQQYRLLLELCKKAGVTQSNLIHALWGFLLSKYNNTQDVVFGSVVSGRPPQLTGVEHMIGLFINTIPFRVRYQSSDTALDLIKRVQEASIGSTSHHYMNLSEVQSQSELGMNLMDHVLVFENYPVEESLAKGNDPSFEIEQIEVYEENNFDFSIWVCPTADELHIVFKYDQSIYSDKAITRSLNHFHQLIMDVSQAPEKELSKIEYLPMTERKTLLETFNQSQVSFQENTTILDTITEKAARSSEKIAITANNQQVSYAQLQAQSDHLAQYLLAQGVGEHSIVALCYPRTSEMIVGILGIMKSGATYLPIDASYPLERIDFILKDSQCDFILSNTAISEFLPQGSQLICLDDQAVWRPLDNKVTLPKVEFHSRAYIIYTSGTTGNPKGVMVSHQNLYNFFQGLNSRFDQQEEVETWLATTTINFDISILELLWTLSNGHHVVLQQDRAIPPTDYGDMKLSLFYFAAQQEVTSENKYKLLLEGAQFADTHGFESIWVPERHFHEFGDQFPNPAVAAAAVAAVTSNVKIRSGSVVLPLHNTIRVAEEWAMVDNLSEGRVELSIASGWHPNDFVLAPEAYSNRHQVMKEQIKELKNLWGGGHITLKNGVGDDYQFTVHPKPIQKSLKVWITASGSIETFRYAGTIGANVLTHLLGQSKEELGEKITAYHESLRLNGYDPKDHVVALMLHTFVCDNSNKAKEIVEEPFKNYLRNSIGLLEPMARKEGLDTSNQHDIEAVVEMGFQRYYQANGLFGTPNECLNKIKEFKEIGVREIACLIDFGIATDIVVDHLDDLNELKESIKRHGKQYRFLSDSLKQHDPTSVMIKRHAVTSLQATPSLIQELILEKDGENSLKQIERLLIGGEALAQSLSDSLIALRGKSHFNMYGPTETTIWSSVKEIRDQHPVSIGKPLANTQLYVLDKSKQMVPIGVPGELYIAGEGVSMGYLEREQLTKERFVDNPFLKGALMYKTGDLVRWSEEGDLEYIGRNDFQIKLNGHRIELSEIERKAEEYDGIDQCVVVPIERNDFKHLTAYIQVNYTFSKEKLVSHLKLNLPNYMVPEQFIEVTDYPKTANGKLDRKTLAAQKLNFEIDRTLAAPSNETEEQLLEIWREMLGVEGIGVDQNFIELGGNSIRAILLINKIREILAIEISLQELFLHPTISGLASIIIEKTEEVSEKEYANEMTI